MVDITNSVPLEIVNISRLKKGGYIKFFTTYPLNLAFVSSQTFPNNRIRNFRYVRVFGVMAKSCTHSHNFEESSSKLEVQSETRKNLD